MMRTKCGRVGLSLSGGGFRASLFHLGVLKRLDELKVLPKITHISSVSGGSITASLYVFLRRNRDERFKFSECEEKLLKAIKKNPRVRWLIINTLLRAALRTLPLTWFGGIARWVRGRFAFDGFFRREFFGDAVLADICPSSDLPRLILNTTGLEMGQDYCFTADYIGPRPLSALGAEQSSSRVDPREFPLAEAVGASACFPPVFAPYSVPITPNPAEDSSNGMAINLDHAHLIDGGVYDNQGLKVFLREARDPYLSRVTDNQRWVDYLIASDASIILAPDRTPVPANPARRLFLRLNMLLRAHDITEDRARWERFGLLIYQLEATDIEQAAFLHTGSQWQQEPPYRFSDEMKHYIACLRTDLDSFSDLEMLALMYLGYTLVDQRVFGYCRDLLPEETREAIQPVSAGNTVSWKQIVRELGSAPPGIEPLKSWNQFTAEIRGRIPKHGWFVNWLNKPWARFMDECDPDCPQDLVAARLATKHLEHGSTRSIVWRGLQRLADRGTGWLLVARSLQTLIVALLLAAAAIAIGFLAHWINFVGDLVRRIV